MSYYTKLFNGPPTGIKGYVFLLGQHGDAVVYELGADGQPVGLTAGKVETVLGGAIAASLPGFRLVDYGHGDNPISHGFDHDRWHDVVKTLNGRGNRARRYRAHLMPRLMVSTVDQVRYDYNSQSYVLTESGSAADRRLDREAEASERERNTVVIDRYPKSS